MSEIADTAEFPLPADVTDEERSTALREIGRHAQIVGDEPRRIRFRGRTLGQTGPIWHFQYTRVYAVAQGFLVAGHDLRAGIVVRHAEALDAVTEGFGNDGVREFIEDELRFRKVLPALPAGSPH
ncbi:MAG TPA: hypothetical protein VM070_01150 [Candidatus Saccharimonadales bacterium]|nr:hypothetical protein [Candidatus Saccharimonadales bacterium]